MEPIAPRPAREVVRAAIARGIASLRWNRRLRIAPLARMLEIDRATWYRWERGESPIPADAMPVIAEYLGVTVADLMTPTPLEMAA